MTGWKATDCLDKHACQAGVEQANDEEAQEGAREHALEPEHERQRAAGLRLRKHVEKRAAGALINGDVPARCSNSCAQLIVLSTLQAWIKRGAASQHHVVGDVHVPSYKQARACAPAEQPRRWLAPPREVLHLVELSPSSVRALLYVAPQHGSGEAAPG